MFQPRWMTITGPKLVRVTEGCVIFWMSLTGPLRSALSAAVKALTERTRSIVFPGTDLLIQGLRLRSFSIDSTAGWSKRFASFATYARVSLSFTAIASGRSVSGAASSARLIAALICGTAPTPLGEDRKLRLPTLTAIGWFTTLSRAVFASAPDIPPTGMPPTVTPGAIMVGLGPVVVVPVVVGVVPVVVVDVVSVDVLVVPVPVAATTVADRPPAARNPSAKRTGRARRRTSVSVASPDYGSVRLMTTIAQSSVRSPLLEGAAVGKDGPGQLLGRKVPRP